MEHCVGLDVSLKLTAICIVDRTGKIVREGVVTSDPETIAAFIKSHAPHVARVGLGAARHLHRCQACEGGSEDADQQE
jgi:transposase